MEIKTKTQYLDVNKLIHKKINGFDMDDESIKKCEDLFDEMISGDFQKFLNEGNVLQFDEENLKIEIKYK